MNITKYKCTACGWKSDSLPMPGHGCSNPYCGQRMTTIVDHEETEKARKEAELKSSNSGCVVIIILFAILIFL